MAKRKVVKNPYPTSRGAAEHGLGQRPTTRRVAAPDGPFGNVVLNSVVNETITAMTGRFWAIEDDCISFDGGVIIWDNDRDVFRVIDWQGVRYRGADKPFIAVVAFDRGMRLP